MAFSNKDPRIKLQEIPIQAAKERRQKGFAENRQKRIEDNHEENIVNQVREAKNIKQLSEKMIALTRSLVYLWEPLNRKSKI